MYDVFQSILLLMLIIVVIIVYKYLTNHAIFLGGSISKKNTNTIHDVFYHGSPLKLTKLEPRKSDLTSQPVVFGTPSYTDAVIFSAYITDYDINMYGDIIDGKKLRCLDEQYPGAFTKLNNIGYIHHLRGDFKPLPSGLGNEYICKNAVIPFKVNKVNILKYLQKSDVIMRKYEDVLVDRVKLKEKLQNLRFNNANDNDKISDNSFDNIVTLTGNVLCNLVTADDNLYIDELRQDLKTRGIDVVMIGHDIHSDSNFINPTVIVGDPIDGRFIFNIPGEQLFLNVSNNELLKEFKSQKTTKSEYQKYINARRDRFCSYSWFDYNELMLYFDSTLIPSKVGKRV